MEHCRCAGWPPRHLGQPGHEPGLEEALLEIIATRDAEATQLSLELIERCEQLRWISPWLADNRARCLVHQGRDQEALAIWEQLSVDSDPGVAAVARDTMAALQRRPAEAALANRLWQLREENQPEVWQSLLMAALLQGHDLSVSPLADVVEALASDGSPPQQAPRDQQLLRHELVLQLYERQLLSWEAQRR